MDHQLGVTKGPVGQHHILKVANPAESAVSINFQTEALLWLERRDPGLPVPKVVRALDGRSA